MAVNTIRALVKDDNGGAGAHIGRVDASIAREAMETQNPAETKILGWGDIDGPAWECNRMTIPDSEWRKIK